MNRPYTSPPNRRRRKGATALAVATLALSGFVAACGGGDDTTGDEQAAGDGGGEALKVGVFFPGSISDTGFMQSGYEGYERAREEHGDAVELSYVEQVAASDYEQALVRFASQNSLVISMGGQTDADVRKVAERFPDVKFVEIGGPRDAEPMPNLAYYDPEQPEAHYLSGAVSASLVDDGEIAYIGGVELPAIVNSAKAFENGAKAANDKAKVLAPQYAGDFNDPSKAKQAAEALVGAGAEVIGQELNLGKQGIEQVVKARDAQMIGGPLLGECGDEAIPGYFETNIGVEIEYAINAVLEDTYEAAQVPFGLTTDRGGIDFKLCTDDAKAEAALEEAREAVASGSVEPY